MQEKPLLKIWEKVSLNSRKQLKLIETPFIEVKLSQESYTILFRKLRDASY